MKLSIETKADRDEVRRICKEAHTAEVECNANDTLPSALDMIETLKQEIDDLRRDGGAYVIGADT